MTETAFIAAAGQQLALVMRLADSLYAVPVESVEEVLPELPIEPLTQGRRHLKGVVFVRGHLISVLDLGARLGLTSGRETVDPHLVCVRVDGRLVALEVDEALDLVDLSEGTRMDVRAFAAGPVSALVDLGGQMIRLLDLVQVVTGDGATA